MKKILTLLCVFLAGLVLNVGMSLADHGHGDRDGGRDRDGRGDHDDQGVPSPADSETGLAGVLMAGGAAYLVWRRRKV